MLVINIKNAPLNAQMNKVKGKIPNITSLTTIAVLITIENKIPYHSKYIIEFLLVPPLIIIFLPQLDGMEIEILVFV